jgi:SAM-dependent methyltransferase
MFEIPTLLRRAEYRALSKVHLSGAVLDLGGGKDSGYQTLLRGEHTITSVNLSPKAKPDILHDLEQPLPLADSSYDAVLLINVLEHVFDYKQLLAESVRVLKPEGVLVVIVPFLFPIHPSPDDFHRWTASALRRECEQYTLHTIQIQPLGGGVFSSWYLLFDRLLPWPFRAIGYVSVRYLVLLCDVLFTGSARALGKRYDPTDYAFGYCVTAVKSSPR